MARLNTILQTICLICVSASTLLAAEQLTNNIALPISAIHFSLTGADLETNFLMQSITADKQVPADKGLHWVLCNTGTNRYNVIFLGASNSFDFKLFAANGTEIPKTELGTAMSVGPKSLKSAGANPHARDEGYAPQQVTVRDFPKITDLFRIPADGAYIFELRYWTWMSSKREFILSNPVRLQVVKKQ